MADIGRRRGRGRRKPAERGSGDWTFAIQVAVGRCACLGCRALERESQFHPHQLEGPGGASEQPVAWRGRLRD